MTIERRIRRLEVAIPPVPAEQTRAALEQWAQGLDDVAGRRACRAETEEDRELLILLQEMAHENR